jgi:nucleoside-diphosphate-sugar epimerase
MKKALVCGAGGFIGSHIVSRLRQEGYWVRGVDLKHPEFGYTESNSFIVGDLRDPGFVEYLFIRGFPGYDEVYQLAANMGGAGFVFTGEHDADILSDSALININIAKQSVQQKVLPKLFYSSSACIYPEYNQQDPINPKCFEDSAYPAAPDSCVHPDTEVLTKKGFKLIVDINLEDEVATLNDFGYIEYHKPEFKHEYDFSGDLINIKTKYLSCKVTPNHNFATCDKFGELLPNVNAKEFISRNRICKGYFKRNCKWIGKHSNNVVNLDPVYFNDTLPRYTKKGIIFKDKIRIKKGFSLNIDHYLEFLGWFITEGNCGFYGGKDYITQIRQYKHYDLVISLIKKMGVVATLSEGRIVIHQKIFWNHFSKMGKGAKNKNLPNWVLELPPEKLKILFKSMMLGDGTSINGKNSYTTTSKRLADQFIEICLKIGYSTSLYIVKKELPYNDTYTVNISKQHLINKVQKDNITYFPYIGKVYDLTVKNHRFFIRHDGKQTWTGNCYGWEKLFSERLYFSFSRNYKLPIKIARFHNIFGVRGTFKGGREKAPAALCRKVIEASNGGSIDIWGSGEQTRSFLYIDECVEGVRRLMGSDFNGPVNIGSDEMVNINKLAEMIIKISGKDIKINHIDGPLGVRGRNSDNTLIKQKLNWCPSRPLIEGLIKTYTWIDEEINKCL